MPSPYTHPLMPQDYCEMLARWLGYTDGVDPSLYPGTIKALYYLPTELPYGGNTPALFVAPSGGHRGRSAAGGSAGGKVWVGELYLIYLDTTPDQQDLSLATITAEMWSNAKQIVKRIEQDIQWGLSVTAGGEEMDLIYDPRGPFSDDKNKLWIEFDLRVFYKGQRD